jgi:hypothetical protein
LWLIQYAPRERQPNEQEGNCERAVRKPAVSHEITRQACQFYHMLHRADKTHVPVIALAVVGMPGAAGFA